MTLATSQHSLERYRESMPYEVLRSWARDAQRELDRLRSEQEKFKKLEEAVRSLVDLIRSERVYEVVGDCEQDELEAAISKLGIET